MKSKYIITIAKTDRHQVFSIVKDKTSIFLFFLSISILYFIVLSPIIYKFKQSSVEEQLVLLKKENVSLSQDLKYYQNRIKQAQLSLHNLSMKMNYLAADSMISIPNLNYGVGGSDTDFVDLESIQSVNILDLDLTALEENLDQYKQSALQISRALKSQKKVIAHYPSIRPVEKGWISSGFGKRLDPFTQKVERHTGVDFAIEKGSNIFATAAGTVIKVNNHVIRNKGYGRYIIIDHGFGYRTLYAHLSEILVKEGQKVGRWDKIALSGNSGKSTAPHLHYSVYENNKPKNPINFILD